MADKQIYPMISEKSWWILRNQFKKTIPVNVNVSYLKSLLSLNSDQSARNILAPLKQMQIIDADGKPSPRATEWRSDEKYQKVCVAIVGELYPAELTDLFPDSNIDVARAKSWFMDTCSLGDNAASKIVSTFSLLKKGEVKTDTDVIVPTTKPKASKSVNPNSKVKKKEASISSPKPTPQQNPSATESLGPTLHIDLQIHISPDASAEQIDTIFASMAKHLYGRT